MPRLTNRIVKAELVHPLVMRLLADEGPAAVSYRRIAAETGLTLSAVRNIWTTQDLLLQRGAAHARELLPLPSLHPRIDADPDAVLREGIRRLLPLTEEQQVAHRALESLRWAPQVSSARRVLEAYDATASLRIRALVDEVLWLREPEPRSSRSRSADQLREAQQRPMTKGEFLMEAVRRGLADCLARTGGCATGAMVDECMHAVDLRLLD